MIREFGGDYRGDCPIESAELKTFFNQLRKCYPDTLALVAFHPRNEGKKSAAQVTLEKMEGGTSGISDIIIAGSPGFSCELKRKDRTKSRLPKVEKEYLMMIDAMGGFACIAYGWEAAWEALQMWLSIIEVKKNG